MLLHEQKNLFKELILSTSQSLNVSPRIVEKDYFVSLILNELNLRMPNLVFRGGTSLSKCYKIINRFSEDIDLTLAGSTSCSQRKKLKETILSTLSSLNLIITNENSIRTRTSYNKYEVKYKSIFKQSEMKDNILVETVLAAPPYPIEVQLCTN